MGGLSAASPVGWSIPSLIAPRESVGTLGGILNFGNQLAGIAAAIITGYIRQGTQFLFWSLYRWPPSFWLSESAATSSYSAASNQFPNRPS